MRTLDIKTLREMNTESHFDRALELLSNRLFYSPKKKLIVDIHKSFIISDGKLFSFSLISNKVKGGLVMVEISNETRTFKRNIYTLIYQVIDKDNTIRFKTIKCESFSEFYRKLFELI